MKDLVSTRISRVGLAAFVAVAALAPARTAFATQPLEEFLARAKKHNYDAREAEAVSRQRQAEAGAALGRLLPALNIRGVYTRNQFDVSFQSQTGSTIVIQPINQVDAFFQLEVPIFDGTVYYSYRASKAEARASEAQRAAQSLEVSSSVAKTYYQFLGANALVRAAEGSVAAAEANAREVETRRSAGVSTELDVARSAANVARSKQDLADAELLVSIYGRELETRAGLRPSPADSFPEDDLREEAPAERWLALAGDSPNNAASRQLAQAARHKKTATKFGYLPSLSALAQERLTNATGFANRSAIYSIQLALAWRLDYTRAETASAISAADDAQRVRAEKTQRSVEDAIFMAHARVKAGLAKSQAARAQADAAARAAKLALARYAAGVATQLDVAQAQRDAFTAEASRIQVDADLAFSRAALRIAAGRPPAGRP